MALREVDPIARADVHAHLTHTTAHGPGVAETGRRASPFGWLMPLVSPPHRSPAGNAVSGWGLRARALSSQAAIAVRTSCKASSGVAPCAEQ